MTSAEENYRLLQEIQANRDFLLLAYRQNPALLRHAGPDVRLLFGLPEHEGAVAADPQPQTDPQRK